MMQFFWTVRGNRICMRIRSAFGRRRVFVPRIEDGRSPGLRYFRLNLTRGHGGSDPAI